MKGIVLAGGSGTRLFPITLATSKQLLPVYDKPMIYYPISTLMLAGITKILVITTPHDIDQFQRLLGNGSQWGIEISFEIQEAPNGIAEALLIGEQFIGTDNVALILGDNIFYGPGMGTALKKLSSRNGATVFAYQSDAPQQFGVVEFSSSGQVISIEEKPRKPKSNFVIPGIYFYDNTAVEIAKSLKPSSRNELEITDLHKAFLSKNNLFVEILDSNQTWFDTGTVEALLEASIRVQELEREFGIKINVPEEVAWKLGYINDTELEKLAYSNWTSGYGKYLLKLLPIADS